MKQILQILSNMFKPVAGVRVVEQISLFLGIGGSVSALFEGNRTPGIAMVAIVCFVIAWFLRSQFSDMGDK